MGKGDKKSAKGKRWKGSYGVSRNKKTIKAQLKRVASKKSSAEAASATPAKARKAPAKKKAEA